MLSIGERLKTVASLVPRSDIVADIGTDHGYVPAFLVMEGKCRRAIALDIAEGPCIAARETRSKYGLQDVMEVRMAPGLQGLKIGEAETIVIAGMGGSTIMSILSERPELVKSVPAFVLQPMNAAELLRQWLTDNRFLISEEVLCKENGHIYVILKVIHAEQKQELSALELEAGPRILQQRPPLWMEYLTEKTEHYRRLLQQMQNSKAAVNSDKYKKADIMLKQMENFMDQYRQ